MTNKELFIKSLNTLLYSWGGDTPSEAYWVLDELIKFYEAETGRQLNLPEYDETGEWAEAVLTALDNEEDELTEEKKRFKSLL